MADFRTSSSPDLDPNPYEDAGYDFSRGEPNLFSGTVDKPYFDGAFNERGVGRAGPLPDGDLPPLTNISGAPGNPVYPSQNIESSLLRLRAEMPFLPIMAIPTFVRSLFFPVGQTAGVPGGVAQDVNIPKGVALLRFAGNSDYWVNFQGRAQVPNAALNFDDQFEGLYKPEWGWIYAGSADQISIVASNDQSFVQVFGLYSRGWAKT